MSFGAYTEGMYGPWLSSTQLAIRHACLWKYFDPVISFFFFPSKSSLIILLDWGHFFNKLGPKELGGAIDLVNQFKLLHHHEFFCKRALPSPLSETHYLRNVVGDTEIRKGEGMELDQLFQTSSYVRQRDYSLCPFDLEVLGEAFRMRDLTPIDLPSVRHLLHMYLSSYSFPILRCISC